MRSIKEERKEVAKERIKELFEQARLRPAYAKRYMVLAKKLKQRYRLKFTKEQSRSMCKKCCAFLIPGKTLTVRTKGSHLVYTCMECGHIMRYGGKK